MFVFAYIMGNINSLISNLEDDQDDYFKKMETSLNQWIMRIDAANKGRTISEDLEKDIRLQLKTYWKYDHQIIQNDTFFSELPQDLRKRVVEFCFEKRLKKFKIFFQGLEWGFIENFLINLYPRHVPKSELKTDGTPQRSSVIINSGTMPKNLYLIKKGTVEICNRGESEKYVSYGKGSYFGDYHLLFKIKSSHVFRAELPSAPKYDRQGNVIVDPNDAPKEVGDVELLCIKRDTFNELCELFPNSAHILRERAYFRRKFIRDRVN